MPSIIPNVVGVYANPWPDPLAGSARPKGSIASLYRRGVQYKANPRDEAYMRALFAERYPDGVLIRADHAAWRREVAGADTIVLVYPDSIGLGFRRIESAVRRAARPGATVRVLNGRRRDFEWTAAVRRQLYVRRMLERTMAVELVSVFAFLVVTPCLLAADLVRGRR
jgi:hypothetical protein